MSLRLRLLVAVGLIAIVALVVADFATYSALRTVALQPGRPAAGAAAAPPAVQRGSPGRPSARRRSTTSAAPGPVGNSGGAARRRRTATSFPNVVGISYIGVVNHNGAVVDGLECPAYVGDHPYRPQLPSPITGFTHPARRDAGGPVHDGLDRAGRPGLPGPGRPRSSDPPTAATSCVQAQTLVDQTGTLHTLFLIELAVTAGAHRVRAGRRLVAGPARPAPARGRRAHRRLHRGGQPRPAGPGRRPADRGRAAGPGAQRHARADPGRL